MSTVVQAPDLDVVALDDHLLVHDAPRATVHALNATARMVWDACARAASADEVVAAVARTSGAPAAAIDLDVRRTLDELRSVGLVRPGWAPRSEPAPLTRRAGTPAGSRPATAPPTSDGSTTVDQVATASRANRREPDHGTLRVSMLGRSATVTSADPEVTSRLRRVLRGVRDHEAHGTAPLPGDHAYTVAAHGTGDDWVVHLDGVPLCAPAPKDDVLSHLLWHLDHHSVTQASSWLTLHAGAVLGPAGVVAIAGQPDAGKSTLTAAATAAGLTYVSDEVVAVDLRTLEVVPYPTPIGLDGRALALLDHLGVGPTASAIASASVGTTERFVDPGLFGAIATRPAPLAAVVLPDRGRRRSVLRSPPRAPVDAALALAAVAFNLDTTREGGLRALVRLAARTPVLDLATADLRAAVAEVARWSGSTACG